MKIHPTASIDPAARIGADSEVGAYAVIGPQVILGERTIIGPHALLEGAVEAGNGNTIGPGAIIGTTPQDLSFRSDTRSGVRLGHDNVIRELCTIHRGTAEGSLTTIGNKNFLMVGVHLGHNCSIGNNVIIANNCLLGGYASVADGAFLGGGSTFHQFLHVGRLAMVQGGSGFSKDVPPFVTAAIRNFVVGLNMIGMRRAGFTAAQRSEAKMAFKTLYLSGMNTRQALAKAEQENVGAIGAEFFEFVAQAKKRGVCAYRPETLNAEWSNE